jgi:hypothetical protein
MALLGCHSQKFLGPAALAVFLREEAREVPANDLLRRIALDAFAAGIPGDDGAVPIEQVNGVVADAFDDGTPPSACMGLSMMSTGNSLPSLRSP